MRSPAPSPRTSQATRLTTSRAPTEFLGLTASLTHAERLKPTRPAQCSQSPIPTKEGAGSPDRNDAVADHGPPVPWNSARTFQVKRWLGVRFSVFQIGLLT